MNKKLIAIFILAGMIIGFALGVSWTIYQVASIASGFIDEELVASAIFQYKNNIRNSYPSIFKNGTE